eukprot:17515-Eustigmatos_ZCMA.PRE.1
MFHQHRRHIDKAPRGRQIHRREPTASTHLYTQRAARKQVLHDAQPTAIGRQDQRGQSVVVLCVDGVW